MVRNKQFRLAVTHPNGDAWEISTVSLFRRANSPKDGSAGSAANEIRASVLDSDTHLS